MWHEDRMAMSTTTLNISFPGALKEHLQKRVAEGAFSNASDFVGALIRLDMERQEKLAASRWALTSSIVVKVSTESVCLPIS
jgi:Arc/MetJ-type ribon-helix-helix transcriptional regulator